MRKTLLFILALVLIVGKAQASTAILQSSDGNAITSSNPLPVTLTGTTGNLGIGTPTGVNTLTVSGNASIGAGYVATTAPTNGLIVQGNVGIGTIAPLQALDIAGSLNISNSGSLRTANTVRISSAGAGSLSSLTVTNNIISTNGNVGIGSTAPGSLLDVFGSQRILNSGNLLVTGGSVGIGTVSSSFQVALPLMVDNGADAGATYGNIFLNGTNGSGIYWYNRDQTAGQRNWMTATDYNQIGDFMFRVSTALGGNPRTAGLSVMELGSDGNVGIGTLAPATLPVARLHVVQSAAADAFRVDDVNGTDTTPFVIDQTGNVGIGTTIPASKLTIGTSNIGQKVSAANTACATTCGQMACFFGEDTGVIGTLLDCSDATADVCICSK